MRLSLATVAAAAALSFALVAAPALASQVQYHAVLSGQSETPPNDSKGTGTVDATYDTDTKTLTWKITYQDMSGDATAAHFHGPAKAGEKADPVVPIPDPLASPISGSATLTDAQYDDLNKGMWYFNLHTAKFPDGEVRGQMAPPHP